MNGDGAPQCELGPRAAELATLARRELGHLSAAADARGLAAVLSRLALRRGRWTWSLALGGLAAAGAIALLVPWAVRRQDAPPAAPADAAPLALQVEGASLEADGAIRPAAGSSPALRFCDGTVIGLRPGTKGRVASVDSHGARIAIADGSADVNVVPRPQARWQIDAGPFAIHVHGTVFTAAWNAAEGRLDVKLQRGAVSVDGPLTSGAIAMHAGQRLTVATRESRVLLRPLDDQGDAPPPPPALAPPPAARASERPIHEERRSWPAALAAGDFAAIVEAANRDLPRALRTARADDLAALADAARYQRQDGLARQALEAQRQRFPGSPRAADAAFFLGRLDENGGGGLVRALRWYDRYLEEAPNGSYAAEALGRRMIALRELYGIAAARPAAEAYVRRFPRGTYAGAARAMLGDSSGQAP